MTIEGTVAKTAFFLGITVLSAASIWTIASLNSTPVDGILVPNQGIAQLGSIVGAVGGLIMALLTIFKKNLAAFTGTLYSAFEGLLIGSVSVIAEAYYPGIAFQAGLLTFGTLFSLLAAYRSGMIKATKKFKMGVVAATGGIFLIYMASFVMGFFGVHFSMIHDNGLMGIGFSLFVVVVAALNLVLDFDFIERSSQSGAPKYMEWYAAFGLMVTLIWLYLEILRLLIKLRGRD